MKRAGQGAVIAGVIAWYAAVYLIVRPLADAPVIDAWIYSHAVRLFAATGRLRFAGFTEAMPVAQVVYGAAWGRLFGAGEASLDLSVACLGAIGAILLYALLIRCGAGRAEAAIASGLLAANPCYLFLSFSFMTDIPFIVLMIAAMLAFAKAEPPSGRLWICAALSVAAFMIRPFAAAAIAGLAGATIIYDLRAHKIDRRWVKRAARRLAPLAFAAAACAGVWISLMVMQAQPFRLARRTHLIGYFFTVGVATYIRAGILGPLLYLGIVLSPLALVQVAQLAAAGMRRAAAIAATIFTAACVLIRLDPKPPATPELSCFGGWSNALLLRGLPYHFEWHGAGNWIALALGSAGAAGLIVAAQRAWPKLNRAGAAIVIAAACYWAGTIPLWLFNDRYYLFLVPAAALILALTPIRSPSVAVPAALAMTAIMGFASAAGLYDYQRGLGAVIAARDALEREGVPRPQIDAGYSLNGADLYHFADQPEVQDSLEREQGIPMITSSALDDYTIAAAPIVGTEIVRRLDWPGACGSGRDLYVLRRTEVTSTPGESSPVK
jgi:4-amino-4-deoxy-L-arabinose transferase-like glycosyltransferase